jgi:hypothetical protein
MTPAFVCQLPFDRYISRAISINLGPPEFSSSARQSKKLAVVPMPKTAMNKNNGPELRKGHVWFAGQVSRVKAVAKPPPMKTVAYRNLGTSVFRADTAHHPAARRKVNNISH